MPERSWTHNAESTETVAVQHRIAECLRDFFRRARLTVLPATLALALLTIPSCRPYSKRQAEKTITLIDQSWIDKASRARLNEELQQFTKSSGIQVEVLPAPEAAVDQLATWRKLLESGASVPDVYAIDVIWPGVLADQLLDLKSYIPEQEVGSHFPELIANNTANGRLVALPYNTSAGLLFYRVDLLHQYGFRAPPKTWNELDVIAARIQSGERAKGHADFWGYVWQGAPSEALTCNALEWQVAEGGGTIIENGRVTVNNPRTIHAWDRAAHWVGSISPPGVVAYKEWDAFNIWQAGKAAFMRNWTNAYVASQAQGSPTRDKFGIAALPSGGTGTAATLGGNGYGISRHSLHPHEAAMLVRFLCGREEQRRRCLRSAEPATIVDLYHDPRVLAVNPYFSTVFQIHQKSLALRPSTGTGRLYPEISRAYYEAVHAVLTRQTAATDAVAALERRLMQITGFKSVRTASAR